MNKLIPVLLIVSTSASAQRPTLLDIVDIYAPRPQIIYVAPAPMPYALPPTYIQPIQGNPYIQALPLEGARIHDTPRQRIDIYED